MKTILDFPDLFHAVQMGDVFADSKTFPDCEPKADLDKIYAAFLAQRDSLDFDLKVFVNQHFEPLKTSPDSFVFNPNDSPKRHIKNLWPHLIKSKTQVSNQSTYLPLPKPFVVPGGRFQEVYYWDTFFTLQGLQESGMHDEIRDMIENFAYLIDTYGFIPNGNRSYFLSRSQPPFFSMMLWTLVDCEGVQVFQEFLPAMLKEYEFWMRGAGDLKPNEAQARVVKMSDGEILNRYWDDCPEPRPESYREDIELAQKTSQPAESLYRNIRAACESGWDFSTRWFADPDDFGTIQTTNLVPIDLNCLLYYLEKNIAYAYQNIDVVQYQAFKDKAKRRKAALLKYCWNETEHFFYDYNWATQRQSEAKTIAGGAFPLYFGLVDFNEAEEISDVIERDFLKEGGVLTTLCNSGQQWDAPNGWAPLQWMTYYGLDNYAGAELAQEVKRRWLVLNERVFKETGKFTEKYNVTSNQTQASGGEYPNQDGFGWTNGVYLSL